MTGLHLIEWTLLLAAFFLIVDRVRGLYERGVCTDCGGRGGHRKDCKRR